MQKNRLLLYSILFIFLNGTLNSSSNPHLQQRKHVIGCFEGGFFSIFFTALNHLSWCEKKSKAPIIYWDNRCLYYQSSGYNGFFNAWEYYFEKVSSENYVPGDYIHRSFVAPDNTALPLVAFNVDLFKNWLDSLSHYHLIINKYVKIKPQILGKIHQFWSEKFFSKKTIGIHLRGTDKHLELKQTNPIFILQDANKYSGYQYFVTTDELALLELAKKILKGNVIYYDSFRSSNGTPIHHGKHDRAKRGEEVLIEAMLLARCDLILHTASNVPMACYYFNPNLKGKLFINNQVLTINI